MHITGVGDFTPSRIEGKLGSLVFDFPVQFPHSSSKFREQGQQQLVSEFDNLNIQSEEEALSDQDVQQFQKEFLELEMQNKDSE